MAVHTQRRALGRMYTPEGRRLLEDRRLRMAGAFGMLGMVVVHLIDLPEKQEEASYMAAMFEALIVACVVLTPALVLARPPLLRYIWIASGTLALLTVIGFVLSRSIGLPRLEDHVGDWENPVGLASLILEAIVIATSAVALRTPTAAVATG